MNDKEHRISELRTDLKEITKKRSHVTGDVKPEKKMLLDRAIGLLESLDQGDDLYLTSLLFQCQQLEVFSLIEEAYRKDRDKSDHLSQMYKNLPHKEKVLFRRHLADISALRSTVTRRIYLYAERNNIDLSGLL